jgi:mRNA interferase RelE/StbE
MAYQVKFEAKALKDFNKLDNSVKVKIKEYLKKLETIEDPRTQGKPLTGNLAGLWRYRVDMYRIAVDILDNTLVIVIIAIDKRDKIYEKTDKRLNK